MDIFSFVWFLLPPPQTTKRELCPKKSSKRTFQLNQSLACSLACQRACLLQNLQLIVLYPNGTKLAHLNRQEIGSSTFSNFNNIHVRNKQEKNYRQYPLVLEKGSSSSSISCTFPSSSYQPLSVTTL